MNYPQGSEWRKWDLHVHTPASIFHNFPGDAAHAWTSFIADLEGLPAEFKVIGINDYLFLDGYKRVIAEKAKGRLSNIDLFLPVVELRLDKFVGHESHFQRVNFHIIFDAIDPEVVETQFINLLSRDFRLLPAHQALHGQWSAVPTRKSLTDFGNLIIEAAPPERKKQYGEPLREGFNNFNVTLDNVKKALDSTYFRGRYLTAVGKTEWDAITWGDASIAEKRNVIHNADIVFTSAETVAAFQKGREALTAANVNDRLLDCSDAHWLSTSADKDRVGKCFTWIKADTTFAGLQHAIKEYDKRVFVGHIPDKTAKVSSNPTKYLKNLEIRKVTGSQLTDKWFDCSIPLNTDLIAVVGNKGSGKSALADTLGLLGDTKQSGHFSFLNEQKFRDPRENKAAHFQATITWASGVRNTKRLDVDPDPDAVETIKYLPQNYLEDLCNEIAAGSDSRFDRELKQIIFSHVGSADRLGRDSLDEVISYLTSETQSRIRTLTGRIREISASVVEAEERSTESFRTNLESQLRLKRDELAAHEKTKPTPVPAPTQDDAAQKAAAEIRAQITNASGQIGELSTTIQKLDKERGDLAKRVVLVERVTARLDNFKLQFDEFRRLLALDLQELNITPPVTADQIAQATFDRGKLTRLRGQLASEVTGIDQKLDSSSGDSLISKRTELEKVVARLQNSLDEPNRKYVAYQAALEVWTKKRATVIGDPQTPQSISSLENRLKLLEEMPAKVKELRDERLEVTRSIYREVKSLTEAYRRLYRPVQEFVQGRNISSEAIPLMFQVAIADQGFLPAFLERINRQVRGTFSGIEESNTLLRRMLQAVTFDDEESTLAFVQEIDESLHADKRPDVPAGTQVRVADQLRKGETAVSIYEYLYSLPFLAPRYTLQYGGHDIHQLSPGERGLLLLVFYLLIDKDDIPLVIDQPEENLDNQTIYEVLVRALTDAKRRRQVIVVTHNPNLAVVCDAEEVVYARRDKSRNVVEYDSGAIENPRMNKHVIDVLEGTRPAFKNRDSKYFS